jgi:hypothetical protein
MTEDEFNEARDACPYCAAKEYGTYGLRGICQDHCIEYLPGSLTIRALRELTPRKPENCALRDSYLAQQIADGFGEDEYPYIELTVTPRPGVDPGAQILDAVNTAWELRHAKPQDFLEEP